MKEKYFHIELILIQNHLFYLTPTVQLDLKPLNGQKLHIKAYFLAFLLQIEIGRKTAKKLGNQFLA